VRNYWSARGIAKKNRKASQFRKKVFNLSFLNFEGILFYFWLSVINHVSYVTISFVALFRIRIHVFRSC
jgi:hypothetical protein